MAHAYDDTYDIDEGDGGGHRERQGRDGAAAREGLSEPPGRRLGGNRGHDDKNQQDPVPAGGAEDDGQDETDEIELDHGADGAVGALEGDDFPANQVEQAATEPADEVRLVGDRDDRELIALAQPRDGL